METKINLRHQNTRHNVFRSWKSFATDSQTDSQTDIVATDDDQTEYGDWGNARKTPYVTTK